MKKIFTRKIVTFLSIFSLLLQSASPLVITQQVFAQEPSPTIAETPAPTETPTITPEVTQSPEPTQQEAITPSTTQEPTPEPTQEEAQSETGNEDLSTVVVENASAKSIDLESFKDEGTASLTTDKPDYAPTDTAIISGSGLVPNEQYTLTISSSDEPPTSKTVQVTADSEGKFAYAYQLDGIYRPNYSANIKNSEGTVVATVTFTDAAKPSVNLDQCANGGVGDPPISCTGSAWQNGNLGQSQAHYQEGDTVPYRTIVNDIVVGEIYTVKIEYDTTQSGKHAIDYLKTFNTTEGTANPCIGVAGVPTCASPTTFPIPLDPNVSGGGVTQASGNFTMYNGTISGTSAYTLTGTYGGNSSTSIIITFTAIASGSAVLTWGGHIATRADWGAANSAIAISGSPYHMRLIDFTCTDPTNCSSGNQDRSLSAEAIIFPATITIIKNAVPDNAQDFAFTTTGTDLSNFSLDDDNDQTLSNTKVFSNITTFGTKTITEGSVSGWALTSLSCTESGTQNSSTNQASRLATLIVEEGENISCTFTNTLQQAQLTLVKTVTNDNGGSAAVGDWTLSASGPTPISGTTGSGAVTNAAVNQGTYTLSENNGPSGYTAGTYSCVKNGGNPVSGNSITLAANDNATCTINNNDQAATLIVKKVVVNDNGGTATADDFSFQVNGGTAASFEADGQNDLSVNAGTYDVTEPAVTGYSTTYDNCTDVSIPNGGSATCTITNNDNSPSLTLVKVVTNNNGGTAVESSWTLTANGPTGFNGPGPSVSNGASFDAGTYDLSESAALPGYTNGTTWTCVGGTQDDLNTITLGLGQSATCTITNDDEAGHLIVHKVTVPDTDTTTEFSITASGGTIVSPTATQTIVGGNTVNYTVNAGTYDVTEATLAGWDETSNTCDDVVVANGETKHCTITNTKRAHIVIVKDVVGNPDPTDFTFNNNFGNGNPATFLLDEDTNATLPSSRSFEVLPGTYTVSEDPLAGWQSPESTTCTSDENIGSIDVAPGETVTCTFVNEELAKIVLVKNTVGGNGDFDFDGTGSGLPSDIDLTTVGGTATQTFDGLDQDNTYSISETVPSGWTLTSSVCTGGNTPASITPDAGETVTCTFTNTKDATLKLVKTVTNNNGGTAVVNDFQGKIDGNNVPWDVAQVVTASSHTASETTVAGYAASNWGGDCAADGSVSLSPGENKTCTITNDDIAPKLHLRKVVTNNNGGSATVADFTLTADGTGSNDLSGTSPVDSGAGLLADTFALSETNPGGYTAGSWVCVGGTQIGSNITLGINQEATCTITNDDQQAFVIVDKTVINNNGGTAQPNDFLLTVDGNAVQDGVAYPVNPGTHTAGETLPSGYSASAWGGDCDANASVTVALGQTKTCTITNDDIAPKLHLRKIVTNDDGGEALVSDWILNANGAGSNDLSGTTPVDSTGTLQADTFALSETGGPSGYTASAWVCVGGTQNGSNITLGLNQEATCTITNDDQPGTLIVKKVVINDNGGTKEADDFSFQVNNFNTLPFEADGQNDVTVPAGTYDVTEPAVLGYETTYDACSDLVIPNGGTATCTITNDDIAPKLNVIKHVENTHGGTLGASDFTMNVSGNNVSDPSFPGSESGTQVTLDQGTYEVTENEVTGYTTTNTSSDCSGSINVGEEKTCTITNGDTKPMIKVIKHVINDNGGDASASDFTINVTATNPDPSSFPGNEGGTDISLDAGSYSVDEGTHTGYTKTLSADCAGSIAVGQTKTCTITNDDIAPQLHLRKVVVNNNGGTALATAWTLTANGTGSNDLSGTTPVDSTGTLQADTFALSETGGPSGYTASSWVCVNGQQNGSNITVNVGQEATCTITNDDIAPQLTVIKHVINDSGDIAVAADFTMQVTGTNVSTPSFPGSETGVTVTLNAGSYSVDEATNAGYVKTLSADCTGTIAVGQTKTCTITNNDTASATRTQGFWQTHTAYTNSIFAQFGGTLQIGSKLINTQGRLYAGFYSSIPKKSDGKTKRASLDQARMQMLQQWLAAKLNCKAFGCSSSTQTLLSSAATAWAGTNTNLILSYASQLDTYNNSNDALPIAGQGKATPKSSQSTAGSAISYWDTLP